MAKRASAGAESLAGAARLALAFTPWLTFWGLIIAGRPGMAAPLGALLALLLALREMRLQRLRPFSLFTLVFLSLAALIGALLGPSLSDRLTGLLAGGFFFLLAAFIYGLIQREPFALPYLAPEGEASPDLRRAAVRVSWFWSAACLYGFIVCLLGLSDTGQAALDASVHLALWPMPVVLVVSLGLLAPIPAIPVPAWLSLPRLPSLARFKKTGEPEVEARRFKPAEPETVSRRFKAAPPPATDDIPKPRHARATPVPPEPQRAPEATDAAVAPLTTRRAGKAAAEDKEKGRKKSGKRGVPPLPDSLGLPEASFGSGYTAVIVGGGLGGLVCGALLVRAGASVILAERHDQVGGYFNSYRTGGFLFDVGPQMLLGLGTGPWAELNRHLGIDGRMDPRRLAAGVVVGETALRLPDNLTEFTAKLIKRFPSDKKGLYRLLNDLEAFAQERAQAANGNLLPPENPRELRRYVKQRPRACELAEQSYASYLATFVQDAGASCAWSSLSLLLGEEAASVSAAAMADSICCLFEEGGYCLGGGNQSYATALADLIRAEGGTILEGQGVREILLSRDGDAARGVILDDGTVIKSEAVVSDAGFVQTVKRLIRAGACEPGYLKWAGTFEPSPSSVVLYLALEGDLDLPDHIYLTPPEKEHIRLPGGNLELSTVLLNVGSHADPSRARPGHHAVTMSTPVPPAAFEALVKGSDEESLAAQITAAAMQRMALTAIPDLYERLVFQELASPLTLHQLTLSYKGAAFGLRQTPGQELMARPGVKSPIEGLWFVGADTRYGVGARGAVLSGLAAYREMVGGGNYGGRGS